MPALPAETAKCMSEHLSRVRLLALIAHAAAEEEGTPDAYGTLHATVQERIIDGMKDIPRELTISGGLLSSDTKSFLADFLVNQWKKAPTELEAMITNIKSNTTGTYMTALKKLAAKKKHHGLQYIQKRALAILHIQVRLILEHTLAAKATGATAPSHAYFEGLLHALAGLEFEDVLAEEGLMVCPNVW